MPVESQNQPTEIITAEVVQVNKPLYKRPKFIFFCIGLVLFIALIAWLIHIFSVYKNASQYKKAYDIMERELTYCDSIKTQKESQNVFNYCELLGQKFKEVKRGL